MSQIFEAVGFSSIYDTVLVEIGNAWVFEKGNKINHWLPILNMIYSEIYVYLYIN